MSKPTPFQPVRYGPYTLLRPLARGGMGELFVAHDPAEEGPRLVALKRMLPEHLDDEDMVKMFEDEARLAGLLQHNNIVRMRSFDRLPENDRHSYYITFDYLECVDSGVLAEASRSQKSLELVEIAWILVQVCQGLDYAHERRDAQGQPLKIVHRDITPSNILVTGHGDVKIADFGIAKFAQQTQVTREGTVKGKLAYSSPELLQGEPVDHRHDIYTAGIVLWELLTGRQLVEDEKALIKRKKLNVPAPSDIDQSIPRELDAIALKALQPNRDQRYPRASAFAMDLMRWLGSQGAHGIQAGLAKRVQALFGAEFELRRDKLRQLIEELGLPEPRRWDEDVEGPTQIDVGISSTTFRTTGTGETTSPGAWTSAVRTVFPWKHTPTPRPKSGS